MTGVAAKAISWTESGLVPDTVIRSGMRRLLEHKLVEIHAGDVELASAALYEFTTMMRQSPVALVPELANEQHYEVPAAFFEQVLGENRKYSCCHWSNDVGTLAEAERRDIRNVDVHVRDMNDFDAGDRYDRIVSIEMFEHMRNYDELFRRVNSWLEPDGRFFMHIFTHRSTPYEYIDKGPSDWMSRHFFSGGIMPSADLPLMFPEHLNIERRWHWNGMHYAKTCRAWLERMDARRADVMPILAETYGEKESGRWWMRWRMFFMACEELFRYNGGNEWFVSHYRFKKAGN